MFSPEEATAALRNYCVSVGRRFPANPIYTLKDDGQPMVRISSRGGGRREPSATFAGEELIAPLLLFSQKKRIPLPAHGVKALTTIQNLLTLVIKTR